MSLIRHIIHLPDLDWAEHSAGEYHRAMDDVIAQTDVMVQLGNAAVVGLCYDSFLSPPWFWFLLAKDVTLRDLIEFKKLTPCIPFGSLTAVQSDYAVGFRFAEFYGFEKTEVQCEYAGQNYTIFRKK